MILSNSPQNHLLNDLRENAPLYDAFQAVLLCERLVKQGVLASGDPQHGKAPVIRFRPYENYSYAPTDLRNIEWAEKEITFVFNFMGLYGLDSPLPRCYHEEVALQCAVEGNENVALQKFFDIFNHRLYWLYFQAWKKYRGYLFQEDAADSALARMVFFAANAGLDSEALPDPHKLLYCAGVLGSRSRNKTGLEILLKEFFPGLDFRIKEFITQWVEIENIPTLQTAENDTTVQLGRNSLLGSSIPDCTNRIRIEIGNLDLNGYHDFLFGGRWGKILKRLLNLYLHDGLEYDLLFRVNLKVVPGSCMGDEHSRLGCSLWIGKPEDTVSIQFRYEELASKIG